MFVYVEKVYVSHPSCSEFMIIVSMSDWDMHAKRRTKCGENEIVKEKVLSRDVYKLINLLI